MAISIQQFSAVLEECGLMPQEELRALLDALPEAERPADTKSLALLLVREGKLTAYQANTLYQGKGRSLAFAEYQILDKIGSGGMGVVFQARHRRMERIVALKVLPPSATKDPESVTRFLREVRTAARLNHPNIVTAYDAGEFQGVHYLVMEYVDGNNLSVMVKRGGPLAIGQAVDCIIQAARGLEHAHAEGVIHRDVKPANLLLDKRGVVKVLDMGLARFQRSLVEGGTDDSSVTDSRYVSGTVDYMAPEQATKSREADHRVDIYSLGCTLYYLLTGQRVYPNGSVMEKLIAHQDDPVPSLQAVRPEVTPMLDAVFQRMMAKDPAERLGSMGEVIAALESCAGAWNDPLADVGAPRQPTDEGQLATFFESLAHEAESPAVAVAAVAAADTRVSTAAAIATSQQPVAMPRREPALRPVPGTSLRPVPWLPMGVGALAMALLISVTLVWASLRNPAPQAVAALETPSAVPSTATDSASNPAAPTVDSTAKPAAKPSQPAGPPVRLRAPFTAEQASAARAAWAQYAGVPDRQSNSVGMTLLLIPPGEFQMGTSETEARRILKEADSASDEVRNWLTGMLSAEQPQHTVRLRQPFYLAAHEVTQAQFEQVTGRNPSSFSPQGRFAEKVAELDTGRLPVHGVSWVDAVDYCNALSVAEGLPPYYEKLFYAQSNVVVRGGPGYRLPTEAEWEYACRAGTTSAWSVGNALYGDQATFHSDSMDPAELRRAASSGTLRPTGVGTFAANAFGLFDMHGNVAEWCNDWWSATAYQNSAVDDPIGPLSASNRVVRGGHWLAPAVFCRSAARPEILPKPLDGVVGFRVARTIETP